MAIDQPQQNQPENFTTGEDSRSVWNDLATTSSSNDDFRSMTGKSDDSSLKALGLASADELLGGMGDDAVAFANNAEQPASQSPLDGQPNLPEGSAGRATTKALEADGMVLDQTNSFPKSGIYIQHPANGKPDAWGRTRVETGVGADGSLNYQSTSYKDGHKSTVNFDKSGNVESTETTRDGKTVTHYPGISGDASSIEKAWDNADFGAGHEAVKKEVDKIIAEANGDWSKISKILDEAAKLGVPLSNENGNWSLDGSFSYGPIATNPAEAAAAARAAEPVEQPVAHPVTPAADYNGWNIFPHTARELAKDRS